MKGLFRFRRAKQRRLAMTFGYEYRPSFWRTIRSNSHLVIAAGGTASFLGVAGIALWLAMPSAERAAFADTKPEVLVREAPPVETATVSDPQPGAAKVAVEATVATAPKDVRWKAPAASQATATEEATTKPAAQDPLQAVNKEAEASAVKPTADATSAQVSAFAAANRAEVSAGSGSGGNPDDSSTAAIPTPKPRQPAVQASADSEPDDAAPAKDADVAQGHTLRAVTMRSGPKKGASAMGTVPAKTAVQIVTCNQWCQIVYNGKRGWIYKSYVSRDN